MDHTTRRLMCRVDPETRERIAELGALWGPCQPLEASAVVRVCLERCFALAGRGGALPARAPAGAGGPGRATVMTCRLAVVLRPQAQAHLEALARAWGPLEPLTHAAVVRAAVAWCHAHPGRPQAAPDERRAS